MKKWNMIIDVEKCHDCNNCFLACKDEFVENDYPPLSLAQPMHGHRWMDIFRKERGQYPKVDVSYLPHTCMHCDDAPCIKTATEGAAYKRDDGIVIIDPKKAKGQKDIVKACPYDAIWWNDESSVAQKCTFCSHLLDDGWKEPRCVQACPTEALRVVKVGDAEMMNIIKSEKLSVYKPEYGSKPRIYYKNIYRFTTHLIAGSVALRDTDECAEGAKITLINTAEKKIEEAVTNNYGDFKLDGLSPGSGQYKLKIEYPGYERQMLTIELKDSMNLGTILI